MAGLSPVCPMSKTSSPHSAALNDPIAHVFDQLNWTSDVNAHSIVITASGGVVTLSGTVTDARSRAAASEAALRTRDVRTIDNQITVGVAAPPDPLNTAIAREVETALQSSDVPRAHLRAEVSDRIVTLSGSVDWGYEREQASRCLQGVPEMRELVNRVGLVRRPNANVTMGLIRRALPSNTLADVVHVSVLDSEVTITGIVQSEDERVDAERAAWSSPHVSNVHNQLKVRPL